MRGPMQFRLPIALHQPAVHASADLLHKSAKWQWKLLQGSEGSSSETA